MDLPVLLLLPTVFLLVINGGSPAYAMAPQHDNTRQYTGHDKPTPASLFRQISHLSLNEIESEVHSGLSLLLRKLQDLSERERSSYIAKLLEDSYRRLSFLEELMSKMNDFVENLGGDLRDTSNKDQNQPDDSTLSSRRNSSDVSREGSAANRSLSRWKRTYLYPFYIVRNIITMVQVTLVMTRAVIVFGTFLYNRININAN